MTYIYDITLNFNETLYDFFEWNSSDSLKHIRKIPIFKVSNDTFLNMLMYEAQISDDILKKIKDKTDSYGKKTKSFTSCLIRNEENIIALKFDNNGISKQVSTLIIEEELDVLEIKVNLTKTFEYKTLNKRKFLTSTRYDNINRSYLQKQINNLNIDKDKEKIKYLYFEYFGNYINDELNALNKLKKEISKDNYSNNLKEFFKLSSNKY